MADGDSCFMVRQRRMAETTGIGLSRQEESGQIELRKLRELPSPNIDTSRSSLSRSKSPLALKQYDWFDCLACMHIVQRGLEVIDLQNRKPAFQIYPECL